MRRLSERVKFGMKRAYENGKVLGNSNIYGYTKENGKLEIDEDSAKFVRDIFELYASGKYGYRTLARMLNEMGYTNTIGQEINPATLKGILTNPKYKGYYHGRLTESNDYKKKKSVKLPESERLLYKDDSIPAIVSEELWERANAVVSERTEKYKKKNGGNQQKFAYSGKIKCEEHGTYHYRKVWKDRKVPAESWCCRVYLAKGRKACSTPIIYTRDIDSIMEYIGNDLLNDKEKYISSVDKLLSLYENAENGNVDYSKEIGKLNKDLEKLASKKEKLLELYTDGDIEKTDYLTSNTRLTENVNKLKESIDKLITEEKNSSNTEALLGQAKEFFQKLSNENFNTKDVAQEMLEEILVLEGSTKDLIKIKITMKYGEILPAVIARTNILYGVTEVSPIVGSEEQSNDLVKYLKEEMQKEDGDVWELNMFGKSMHDLVKEGLNNKLYQMPEDTPQKIQETLQKIINDGRGTMICILL